MDLGNQGLSVEAISSPIVRGEARDARSRGKGQVFLGALSTAYPWLGPFEGGEATRAEGTVLQRWMRVGTSRHPEIFTISPGEDEPRKRGGWGRVCTRVVKRAWLTAPHPGDLRPQRLLPAAQLFLVGLALSVASSSPSSAAKTAAHSPATPANWGGGFAGPQSPLPREQVLGNGVEGHRKPQM